MWPVHPSRVAFLAAIVASLHISTASSQVTYPLDGLRVSAPTARSAVVRVIAKERRAESLGSGTLVGARDKYGLVLTNWHVVKDATGPITVTFPNGFKSAAQVLRLDRDWDLAALAIWRPNVTPIAIAAKAPQPGEALTIAGYGEGQYREATGRCTQYVSPGRTLPYEMVEVAAKARQGDSGGPILNNRGELAGVLFGSGGGATSGSYAGRVRRFLRGVWPAESMSAPNASMIATQPTMPAPNASMIATQPTMPAPNASMIATQPTMPAPNTATISAQPTPPRDMGPAPPLSPPVDKMHEKGQLAAAASGADVAGAPSPATAVVRAAPSALGSNSRHGAIKTSPIPHHDRGYRASVDGNTPSSAAGDSKPGTPLFDTIRNVFAMIGVASVLFHLLVSGRP